VNLGELLAGTGLKSATAFLVRPPGFLPISGEIPRHELAAYLY